MFQGFPQETLAFFLDLRFHNDKAFMDANRDRYVSQVREPFYRFIEAIGESMLRIDPAFEVRPYKCLSRINRDVRFSRDKSPYRDHLWVAFRRAGQEKEGQPFYWMELGPEHVDWGVGMWGENRPAMDALRRRMTARPEEYLNLLPCLNRAGFWLGGPSWKRLDVPPEIPPELVPLYMKKEPYFSKARTLLKWVYAPSFATRVARDFTTVAPVYRMLRGVAEDEPPPAK